MVCVRDASWCCHSLRGHLLRRKLLGYIDGPQETECPVFCYQFPAAVSSELNEALDSALASTSDSPPASSQTTLRPPLLTPQDTPLDLEQQWQDLLSLMDLQVGTLHLSSLCFVSRYAV